MAAALVGFGAAGVAWMGAGLIGCRPAAAPRPSVLLFVLDTTRADAVSAYGRVAGTTPAIDALAARGLLYAHAYAQAPWTLPSHATLFTGLLPSQHGLEWQRTRAPDEWRTLAELMRDGGYETVGVSENGWISPDFNMTQGFEHFTNVRDDKPASTVAVVDAWARARSDPRPFLLFVNVTDAHAPFEVRATNAYLPAGVSATAARAISQKPADYFCASTPADPAIAVLWSLYLGDVHAADAKLATVQAALHTAGLDRRLLTVVTADHGEHFGEHGLVNHLFSLREALVHVPLVVHGSPELLPDALPEAGGTVIDTPVQLADVMPSVLQWVGLPVPAGLAGVALPTRADGVPGSEVVAEHDDFAGEATPASNSVTAAVQKATDAMRHACRPTDPVYGGMRTLIRYPYKLIWYERYPPELYDLAADPGETRDLASAEPTRVRAMVAELEARLAPATVPSVQGEPREAAPSAEVLDMLRALGYVGEQYRDAAAPQPHD